MINLTLWEGLALLGHVTWPCVPAKGQAITFREGLYLVTFVTHDMNTSGNIDLVLERI